MKRIGLIGGTTPESTCYYYQIYMEISREKLGEHTYPPLLIYSINFGEFMNNPRGWEGRKRMLLEAGEALKRAGADLIALTANTPHILFDELQEALGVPMVSIIDALVERMKEEKISRPLLLGTKTTMSSGFYREKLERAGFRVEVPSQEEQDRINSIIFEELARGNLVSKSWLLELVEKYALEKGVDSLILGCTELPLAIKEEEVSIRLFDTARIHMEKLIEISTA